MLFSSKGTQLTVSTLLSVELCEVPSDYKADTNEQDGMCQTKWRNEAFQGRQASLGLPQEHMGCEDLLLPMKGQVSSLDNVLIIFVTERESSQLYCFGGN